MTRMPALIISGVRELPVAAGNVLCNVDGRVMGGNFWFAVTVCGNALVRVPLGY